MIVETAFLSQAPLEIRRATIFLWIAFIMQFVATGIDWTIGGANPDKFTVQITGAIFMLIAYLVIYVSKGRQLTRGLWVVVFCAMVVLVIENWRQSERIALVSNFDGASLMAVGYAVFLMFTDPCSHWFRQGRKREERKLQNHVHAWSEELYKRSEYRIMPTLDEVAKHARVSKKVAQKNLENWQPTQLAQKESQSPPAG